MSRSVAHEGQLRPGPPRWRPRWPRRPSRTTPRTRRADGPVEHDLSRIGRSVAEPVVQRAEDRGRPVQKTSVAGAVHLDEPTTVAPLNLEPVVQALSPHVLAPLPAARRRQRADGGRRHLGRGASASRTSPPRGQSRAPATPTASWPGIGARYRTAVLRVATDARRSRAELTTGDASGARYRASGSPRPASSRQVAAPVRGTASLRRRRSATYRSSRRGALLRRADRQEQVHDLESRQGGRGVGEQRAGDRREVQTPRAAARR